MVKAGKVSEAGKLYKQICEHLWSEDELPIIGACTDLPIAYMESHLPANLFVSSLDALADACIRELYK